MLQIGTDFDEPVEDDVSIDEERWLLYSNDELEEEDEDDVNDKTDLGDAAFDDDKADI